MKPPKLPKEIFTQTGEGAGKYLSHPVRSNEHAPNA